MKILIKNFSKGFVKLQIENQDDLWYLSQLISPGDLISGKTIRKIKLGESSERKIKITRKIIFIKLQTEKINYKFNQLKVLGPIIEGPDDISRGSYHSFNLEENSTISIEKPKWYNYQIKRLQEASDSKSSNILITILDREDSIFTLSKKSGYILLSTLQGEVAKKEKRATSKNTFYQDIIQQIEEYNNRYKIEHIILASPAFWKDEVYKLINNKKIKKKITLVTCSSAKQTAINEILKRPETKSILSEDRTTKEIQAVELLLKEIMLENKAPYGVTEVEQASNSGAIEQLLITDNYIEKTREENIYDGIDKIMKETDQNHGKVIIISSNNDGGKKLNGLGGIGAILRFKINY